jgi:hypothetical protein
MTMEIQPAASLQVLATSLDGARSAIEAAQATQLAGSAPAVQHADAILQLSAAAQALMSR